MEEEVEAEDVDEGITLSDESPDFKNTVPPVNTDEEKQDVLIRHAIEETRGQAVAFNQHVLSLRVQKSKLNGVVNPDGYSECQTSMA